MSSKDKWHWICHSFHLFPYSISVTIEGTACAECTVNWCVLFLPPRADKYWVQKAGGRLLLSDFTVWSFPCMTNFILGFLQLLRGLGNHKLLLNKTCLILVEDPWERESHLLSVFVWRVKHGCPLLAPFSVPVSSSLKKGCHISTVWDTANLYQTTSLAQPPICREKITQHKENTSALNLRGDAFHSAKYRFSHKSMFCLLLKDQQSLIKTPEMFEVFHSLFFSPPAALPSVHCCDISLLPSDTSGR